MKQYLDDPSSLVGRAILIDGTTVTIKNIAGNVKECSFSFETEKEAKEARATLLTAKLTGAMETRALRYRRIIKVGREPNTRIQFTGWIS